MTKPIESVDYSPEALRAARTYLNNYIKIASINDEQKSLKDDLIAEAGGETMTIPFPGKGKVTVTAPSDVEPVPGEFSYSFDAGKFADLPQVMKRKLLQLGIVVATPKTKGGAQATVRVTLNV